jgi:hypothetical protein
MTDPEQDQRSEQDLLVDVLLGLRVDRVREFMDSVDLARSGTKAELRERVEEALTSHAISLNVLIDYLDQVEPWGRQHVIMLEAEASAANGWRREDGIRRRLADAGVEGLLDRRKRQRLPESLTLSSISTSGDTIVIVAVERRDYDERAPEYDSVDHDDDGQLIILKAYRHVVTRGIIALRWNTATRAAVLHISEGFGRYDYQDAFARFGNLVSGFLDMSRFTQKDIRRAIWRLHDADKNGAPEARSHRVGFTSHGGRAIDATSPTMSTSVVGERVVDDALTNVAGSATGRIGNFFWLPSAGPTPQTNPIVRDLHVVILARDSRVHFMVPSDERSITYVLQRIRALG